MYLFMKSPEPCPWHMGLNTRSVLSQHSADSSDVPASNKAQGNYARACACLHGTIFVAPVDLWYITHQLHD